MEFKWDEAKSAGNRAKHGIDFTEARRIWDYPHAMDEPLPFLDEPRRVKIGRALGKLWFCVYTLRGDALGSSRPGVPGQARSARMATQGNSGGTIRSLDGTRGIIVEEFDRIADEGSDEMDEFIDWSKARRVAPGDLRDPEAARQGVTASALVARWLTERLDADARPARDHAAE